jgi:hypothetical protein
MGHIRNLCIVGGLGLMLACSSGNDNPPPTPTAATGFTYANPPTSSTNWRFVKNAASTSTHLILDLVPPSSVSGRGVGFTLQSDGKVTWSKVAPSDAELVKPNGVYDLGTGAQALLAMTQSNALTVGVYQKGQGSAKPYDGTTPVLSIAMDFSSSAGLTVGTTIPLRMEKISHLPASGTPVDIKTLASMGTLTAQ